MKCLVSEIFTVVKVTDTHDGIKILEKVVVFFIVFLIKGLSLRFMCSDQHVKY